MQPFNRHLQYVSKQSYLFSKQNHNKNNTPNLNKTKQNHNKNNTPNLNKTKQNHNKNNTPNLNKTKQNCCDFVVNHT